MGEKMNTPSRIPVDGNFERAKNPVIRLAELRNEVEQERPDVQAEAQRIEKAASELTDRYPTTGSHWSLDGVTSANEADGYVTALKNALVGKLEKYGAVLSECKLGPGKNGPAKYQINWMVRKKEQ